MCDLTLCFHLDNKWPIFMGKNRNENRVPVLVSGSIPCYNMTRNLFKCWRMLSEDTYIKKMQMK